MLKEGVPEGRIDLSWCGTTIDKTACLREFLKPTLGLPPLVRDWTFACDDQQLSWFSPFNFKQEYGFAQLI